MHIVVTVTALLCMWCQFERIWAIEALALTASSTTFLSIPLLFQRSLYATARLAFIRWSTLIFEPGGATSNRLSMLWYCSDSVKFTIIIMNVIDSWQMRDIQTKCAWCWTSPIGLEAFRGAVCRRQFFILNDSMQGSSSVSDDDP